MAYHNLSMKVLTAEHFLPRLAYGYLGVQFIEEVQPFHIALEFCIILGQHWEHSELCLAIGR